MYDDPIDAAFSMMVQVVKWTMLLFCFVLVLYWRVVRPDPLKRIPLSIGIALTGWLISLVLA